MKVFKVLLVCASLLPLSGCAGLVVGGVVAGTVVATNERDVRTQYDDKSLQISINRDLGKSELVSQNARVNAVVYRPCPAAGTNPE